MLVVAAAGLMWHSATLVHSTDSMAVKGAAALWIHVAATEQMDVQEQERVPLARVRRNIEFLLSLSIFVSLFFYSM
jgi:hypothetical protein